MILLSGTKPTLSSTSSCKEIDLEYKALADNLIDRQVNQVI